MLEGGREDWMELAQDRDSLIVRLCKRSNGRCSRCWASYVRLRLHWSQNRHNTANRHLSGYTLKERGAY